MPQITTEDKKRKFDTFPAGVVVYIFNKTGQLLLLRHPSRSGWEPINGALDANETVLQAVYRETAEEAGRGVEIQPLGSVHISSFHFDPNVKYMLSLGYVAAYKQGTVNPGDDMTGSDWGWFSVNEILDDNFKLLLPRQKWQVERAYELFQLWSNRKVEELQTDIEKTLGFNKYNAE